MTDGFTTLMLPPSGYNEHWDTTVLARPNATQDRSLVLGFTVKHSHCNARGLCHGATTLGFADLLMTAGSNLQARLSRFLTTVSLNCDFIRPIELGAWVEGHVRVLRTTSRLVFSEGHLMVNGEVSARLNAILACPAEPDPRFSFERYFGQPNVSEHASAAASTSGRTSP